MTRRIMMYTQDSYGLGHLRRATNIANELVARHEDLSILLVVDSPVAPFFDLAERIDFVKLPTVVKVDAGVFRPGRLATSYRLVRAMRANLLRDVMLQFRPHVCLVDHMPGGANRELMPALRALRSARRRPRLVLGLREIIDRPEITCEVWDREGVYKTIGEHYDSILIYGSQEIFPTAREYRLENAPGSRDVHYCGYLCNMDAPKDAARIRAKLGLGEEPIVMAMAGGGSDAYRLLRTFLEAVRAVGPAPSFAAVAVTGPFMPAKQRSELRDMARGCGCRIHTSVGDSVSYINAADVVVSMAGYNTLGEILRFGKRAVIVPRPGPSAEQTMRAEIFAGRGMIHTIRQAELTPARLATEITGCLGGPPPASNAGSLDGLSRVAEVLLDGPAVSDEHPVTADPKVDSAGLAEWIQSPAASRSG